MNNTFIYSLVDQRNRRRKQLTAYRFIVSSKRSAQLFDLGTDAVAIAAVDPVSLDILSDSLFSRFMICHF